MLIIRMKNFFIAKISIQSCKQIISNPYSKLSKVSHNIFKVKPLNLREYARDRNCVGYLPKPCGKGVDVLFYVDFQMTPFTTVEHHNKDGTITYTHRYRFDIMKASERKASLKNSVREQRASFHFSTPQRLNLKKLF